MSETPQSFSSHTRWHPPFHFFLGPVMLINLIWSVVRLIRYPGWEEGWLLVMALALLVLTFLVRINPLKAQDRLIRLEEQLRFQRVLPAELARRASNLSVGNIVALRFAPDEELAGLVQQTLDGKLTTSKEIKQAIKNWRSDDFRV
jgi:Family of unknown function (DUF6526)